MHSWILELVLEYRCAEWYGSNAQLQTVSFGSDVSLHAAISAQRRGNPNPTAPPTGMPWRLSVFFP